MNKREIQNSWNNLTNKGNAYRSAIGRMEASLEGLVDFEFAVVDLPGDGFCILHVDSSSVAPLALCLGEVLIHGILTFELFDGHTI